MKSFNEETPRERSELTAEFSVAGQSFVAVLPRSSDRKWAILDKYRAEGVVPGQDISSEEYYDTMMEAHLLDGGAEQWRQLRKEGKIQFIQVMRIWDWLQGDNRRSLRQDGVRHRVPKVRKMSVPKRKR